MIVDCQHHYLPEEHLKNISKYLRKGERTEVAASHPTLPGVSTVAVVREGITVWNIPPIYTNLKAQIQQMDKESVDVAVLHTGLGQEWITADSAPQINDGMARAVSEYPKRFVGLAHVPQLGDEGLEELDRAVKDLHLKGIAVITNVNGLYPDSEQWQPLLAKADKLGVPIVVHAGTIPYEHGALKSYGNKEFTWGRIVGRAYDLTIFTMRVLTSGILEKYPNLRFCIAHTGGTFFALKGVYLGHSDQSKNVEKLLNRMYFDTAVRSNETEIKCAIELLGPERLVFGSDFPYYSAQSCLKLFDNVQGASKEMILGENAAKLFGIEGN